jgi:7-cyano-7-deazaguanine synthase in queuosine biosynthesis
MAQTKQALAVLPSVEIDVVEAGARTRRGYLRCEIGENIKFSTARLESYFFAKWEPALYDALLVAAAVEFADSSRRRPALMWQREIGLRIPVHDPDRWNEKRLAAALQEALDFVTGDRWQISFKARSEALNPVRQGQLSLNDRVDAVIPFSDGLDSRAVAGLMAREIGDKLVRIRLGSKPYGTSGPMHKKYPFTSVPYKVSSGEQRFVESSARSRGFKFALISGLAAYLAKANRVIIPESGQGSLGPALVTVGQAYEDYRSHPLFTGRMEKFLTALLGRSLRYEFPRLWYTKAETLRKFVNECDDAGSWSETWSCWQQNRQSSVDGKKRQCGVCAACMLRRLSVHAAGLCEPKHTYVWEDLGARTFQAGAAVSFPGKKITGALRQYAIAGALHMDHLAGLRASSANARTLNLSTFQLSLSLGLPQEEARAKLDRLLMQHEREWGNFMDSLGQTSFLGQWAVRNHDTP